MNELLRKILFLPPQSSTISPAIDHLHYFVILTTMGGALLITVVGFWMVVRFRRRAEHEPEREQPGPAVPMWLEGGVIAFLLGLFLLWWLIGFRQYVRIRVAPADSMEVYVTAKQWMWQFSYPEGSHSIATLVVPAKKPVKLIMTARDVIHSFYVPDFRVKQDVLPGRYTTLWFEANQPGTHQILCAEFCGMGHSMMRGEVVVLDAADYGRWLAGDTHEPGAGEDLAAIGERTAADHGCLRCHTLDGTPHIGPSWKGLYLSKRELTSGQTVIADEAYLTESMMDPATKIVLGFKPVMPSFSGRLAPGETAAIVALIKSLRGEP
jgi:cytochrome c oxidase subunit 2